MSSTLRQKTHIPRGDSVRFAEVERRVLAGDRLDAASALFLLRDARLGDLGSLAHEMRGRRVPGNAVTFVIDTNPNYTNACETDCLFCAFYRKPGHEEAYRHPVERIVERGGRAVERGATTALLQGGHNPEIPYEYYPEVVRALTDAYPGLCTHLWSPSEITMMAKVSGHTVRRVLEDLWEAGQRTIPGGGAEILVERVRKRISPKKPTSDSWLGVMREAHHIGYRTTATMMYGHVETDEEIIEHLLKLRDLQHETGGFTAFIPWSFKPGNTLLRKWVPEGAGPVRYLRIIAVARLVLDNFDHIQASWFSEGQKVGQIALHCGGDDFGGTLIEENVLRLADHHNRATTPDCVELIRDAGFDPVQRTTLYERVKDW
ncbi:MAG: dehypoxanthine futalosine cyclase [Gemmatimonadetes bacterium]|nr:dehypoxanthine futalosine cyclase [Gemmatimonadota bacterium]